MYQILFFIIIFVIIFLIKRGGADKAEAVADADERAVVKYFMDTVPESFGQPDEAALKKKFPKLTIKQILGIRKLWAVQQIINFGRTFQNRGEDIDEIIRKYKAPPLTVIKKTGGPELEKYKKLDIYTYPDEKTSAERALKFEKKIGSFIKIPYCTQDELQEKQKAEHGRAVATPDFLFKKPYKGIYWVDAKNFYSANIPFMKKKIIEQAQKYVKMFGPGILVFNYGFNEVFLNMKELKDTKFMGIREFKIFFK